MRAFPLVVVAAAACSGSDVREAAPAPTVAPAPAPAPAPAAAPAGPEAALIGQRPPEWQAEHWLGSPPLTLAGLRGKVVLVRWWTAGCPFCSASAPALRELDETYAGRGLTVVGLYHHKDDGPLDPAVVDATAKKYGFTFPIAVDPDWRTLHTWMRDPAGKEVDTGFTSVTFLLDREGVVRYVHPGGQYVAGDPAYAALTAAIEKLL